MLLYQPGLCLVTGDLTGVGGTAGSSWDSDIERNNESLRSPAGVAAGTSFSLREADLIERQKHNSAVLY